MYIRPRGACQITKAGNNELTMYGQVDPDPKMGLPERLHVRRVAEVKRKGYDVLAWKDEL